MPPPRPRSPPPLPPPPPLRVPTRAARAASAPAAAEPPAAAECATEVLDVVPAVMDALRSATRLHVDGPLSVPQFRCLNFIRLQPASSVSAVAAFLGVTLPTASAMVDRLVRAGAIAPGTAAGDRRRTELNVTAKGRALLAEIHRGAHGEFTRLLSGCSAAELRRLSTGMAVLRRAFQI